MTALISMVLKPIVMAVFLASYKMLLIIIKRTLPSSVSEFLLKKR